MANTFRLISSTVLTGTQSVVSFDSIPQTFTDLVLKISARSDYSNNNFLYFQYNDNSSTLYSDTTIEGNGSTAGSFGGTNQTSGSKSSSYINGTTSTASTFNNSELYIPSYTTSTNKQIGFTTVMETNATNALSTINASAFRGGSAITKITIGLVFSSNFIAGSSFYLYGIKNN